MLSPSLVTPGARTALDFSFSGTNVRVEAPEGVLAVLEATLRFVPRCSSHDVPDIRIVAQTREDVWEIRGDAGSLKVLGAQSSLPQVAGAIVSSAVDDVATTRGLKTMRASVIAKDDRALAMLGDDWESAIALAAHLHGRGWTFLGSDNVFLDPQTLDVIPFQKSLYVNSSSVVQFPVEYRRAVEESPWYVTTQGISFYAVDPRSAGHRETWASSTKLHGIVVVDGAMSDRPSLESLDERSYKSERFARLGVDWSRLPAVDLQIAGFVQSCDLIEHWFESLRT